MPDAIYLELFELDAVREALEVARDAGVRADLIARFFTWASEEPLDEFAEPVLSGRLLAAARRARHAWHRHELLERNRLRRRGSRIH